MAVRLEFDSGTGYELVVRAVAATDRELVNAFEAGPAWRKAAARAELLDRLAMFGSDGWTGLLGLVLDLPGGKDAVSVIEQIAAMPADEVMRYGLGYHRRDFRRLTPEEVFEASVDGDPAARRELRRTSWPQLDRWQTALRQILRLSAEQYRSALVDTMTDWAALATPAAAEVALDARLADDRRATETMRYDRSPDKVIEQATQGVVFVPDVGQTRVVLVPALGVRPIVIALDHRTTMLFAYPVRDVDDAPDGPPERLVTLGKALGDPTRLRILRALRDGDAGAIDLSRLLDVRRTTVLHHIAQLRSAGLVTVTLEGSAGRYRLREDALHDLPDLLAKYLLA